MPNTLTLHLPPRPASVREARAQVGAMTTWWPGHCVATLEVLVDELVTNAILHARSGAELVATIDGRRARVEVHDYSVHPPTARHYGPSSATGRGLHLVEALADRWGVEERPGGKTVWFELDCDNDTS